MSAVETLNDAKARLSGAPAALEARAAKLKDQAERQADLALGEARVAALEAAYGAGRALAQGAADVTAKLPLMGRLSETLADKAGAWNQARAELRSPALAGYDDLNVRQIVAALESLSAFAVQQIRTYEAAHKARVTVLRAADARLSGAA